MRIILSIIFAFVLMLIDLTNGSSSHLSTGDTAPAAARISGQSSVDEEEANKQLFRNAMFELRRGVMLESLRDVIRERYRADFEKVSYPQQDQIVRSAFAQYRKELEEFAVDVRACFGLLLNSTDDQIRDSIRRTVATIDSDNSTLIEEKLQETREKIATLESLKEPLLANDTQAMNKFVEISTNIATNLFIAHGYAVTCRFFMIRYFGEELVKPIYETAQQRFMILDAPRRETEKTRDLALIMYKLAGKDKFLKELMESAGMTTHPQSPPDTKKILRVIRDYQDGYGRDS